MLRERARVLDAKFQRFLHVAQTQRAEARLEGHVAEHRHVARGPGQHGG